MIIILIHLVLNFDITKSINKIKKLALTIVEFECYLG